MTFKRALVIAVMQLTAFWVYRHVLLTTYAAQLPQCDIGLYAGSLSSADWASTQTLARK